MSRIDDALTKMRARMKREARKLADMALRPLSHRFQRLEENQFRLSRELLQQRAVLARANGEPIRVIFLCHVGSIWGKVGPLFEELRSDPRFAVDVVALPYRHATFDDDAYHDGGAADFLRAEGIEPIVAYDESGDHWIDLQSLNPDYIFYPTPYDEQYPASYGTSVTKFYARPCYVPYYGILIYKGEVEVTTHPASFFNNLSMAFVATSQEREQTLQSSDGKVSELVVLEAGAPMLDPLFDLSESSSPDSWNFPHETDRTRILWTPRWRIQEGTSHFLEYSEHLLSLVKELEGEVDFVFRPHPLHFGNLVTGGYCTREDIDALRQEYDCTINARIDESGSYIDTFRTSDLLITDLSSMMIEYFATGKPIIYTHRVNSFNEIGSDIAHLCYWVQDSMELDATVSRLIEGDDQMASQRYDLVESRLKPSGGRSSSRIKDALLVHHAKGNVRGVSR